MIKICPEIWEPVGGIYKTQISELHSDEDVKRISKGDKNAFFIERRDDIIPFIDKQVSAGDCILVMGARDNTLTEFCQKIFQSLVRLSEF